MVNSDLILAIVPKIGSSISIPSSIFIIWEALSDHRNGKGTAIQRALVGMSIVDVCASTAWFLSSWALPAGTAPLSRGNTATCDFQGFLLQLAIGAPLYNCSLALYYLLIIRYNWTNEKLVAIEKYVHISILFFTIGTSIAGLPLTMYNKVGTVCWVVGLPSECGNSSHIPSSVPCDRGDWAWLFGICLFYGPLWICVLLTIIAMALIYKQVKDTFRRNEQYHFQGRNHRDSVMTNNRIEETTEKCVPHTETLQRITEDDERTSIAIDPAGRVAQRSHSLDDLHELDDADNDGASYSTDEGEDEYDAQIDRNIPQRLPPRATTDSSKNCEESGGIGIKSGWLSASNSLRGHTPSKTEEWRNSSAMVSNSRRQSTRARSRQKQNVFATQAILYSLSFFITWMPSTLWSMASWFGIGGFGWDIAAAICEPLQGFWNMLIFIRSRKNSQKKLQRVFGKCCCFWLAMLPNMSESSRISSRIKESNASSGGVYGRTEVQRASAEGFQSKQSNASSRSKREDEDGLPHNRQVTQFGTDRSTSESSQ